jgi:Flp pilus assembly protein TadD
MRYLFISIILGLTLSANAADTSPAGLALPSWLSQAKQLIVDKKFDQAINLLSQASGKQSADWHNLMGFSLRKKSPPDLLEAENQYKLALAKDPKHRGALEYYGELLLLKNDLAGAETMLIRLDKACTFGCEEYTDLKKSVAQFKSRK